MSNTALVPVQDNGVQGPKVTLPASVEIRSKKGRVVGMRTHFCSQGGSKQIREELLAASPTKLTRRELDAQVTAILRGESSLLKVKGRLWLEAAYERNLLPDAGDMRKKSGVLKLIDASEAEKKQATEAEQRAAALALLGMTEEQFAKFEAAKAKAPGQQTLNV